MTRPLVKEESDLLDGLVGAAAAWKGWDSTFVRQDFYIVEVLRALASTEVKDQFFFKGGTSLSKCYDCIRRFSEDVDILVVPKDELSENMIDRMLKRVALEVGGHFGLGKSDVVRVSSRRGANRDSRLAIGDGLLLEMGLVGEPVPAADFEVSSIVSEFIRAERPEDVSEYLEYESVAVRAQSATRTTIEKLAAIHTTAVAVAEDRVDDPGIERKLQTVGKHLYDSHYLLQLDDVVVELATGGTTGAELAERVENVSAEWGMASHPRPDGGYAASPAFEPNSEAYKQLYDSYQQIEPLVFGEFPSFEKCVSTIRANSGLL